ncbi:hypothetical protein OUZ56_021033 [Daphnia magna]|uniref:Uncharacterized protein n=1 Tax=Daphnia magna TaxID=35525 RepID=A0ABQ9ZG70_9CRUS|nr:hypothetical protein OUZ56_021033 [Daphnia magna]
MGKVQSVKKKGSLVASPAAAADASYFRDLFSSFYFKVPETRRFPKRPWRAAHTQKKEKGTELMMMTGKIEIR